jgi:hypothetical protein
MLREKTEYRRSSMGIPTGADHTRWFIEKEIPSLRLLSRINGATIHEDAIALRMSFRPQLRRSPVEANSSLTNQVFGTASGGDAPMR